MADRFGLWIGGNSVSLDKKDFYSVLKYALVPKDLWDTKAFKSDKIGEVITLADDLSVEIVMAMAGDTLLHDFKDAQDLADNIALRKGVIAAMRSICAGDIDGDYVEAVDGVPPTLGYLADLEAMFARGNKSGDSVLTKALPFAPPDDAWTHINKDRSWAGFMFVQSSDVPLSTALKAITPFRGECAGALQLSILLGCLHSYGPEKLDQLKDHFGPAFVGAWRFSAGADGKPITTLATRFFGQSMSIPKDYERGSVLAVPGDYLYFQNKDDYPGETGGWVGENCFYMGQDSLGNPHYSGLGLAWKTEFALRMFLGNAYLNDANIDYLNALRDGKEPKKALRIVEDPKKQVRFVKRALLRFPDTKGAKAPDFLIEAAGAYPLDDQQIRSGFEKLGFKKHSDDLYQIDKIPLGTLMDTLAIGDRDFVEPPSAPFGGNILFAQLKSWRLKVGTADPDVQHPDAADIVYAIAEYNS